MRVKLLVYLLVAFVSLSLLNHNLRLEGESEEAVDFAGFPRLSMHFTYLCPQLIVDGFEDLQAAHEVARSESIKDDLMVTERWVGSMHHFSTVYKTEKATQTYWRHSSATLQ